MNTLLSSVLLALFAVAAVPGALAAPLEERNAETNFSATCSGISFNSSNDNLTATCQNSGGVGTTTTTIGLNSCVGNTNGELTAGNSFSSSCSSISFSGVTLSATCRTPSGGSIRASLDLNSVLSNNNGFLTCP
ncbi:Cyanovirin-N [Mycena capillaripes]|nr:Cyanovirin-N [Mycena capillaripes]